MNKLDWYKKLRAPQWDMIWGTRKMKNGTLRDYGKYAAIHQIPAKRALEIARLYQ